MPIPKIQVALNGWESPITLIKVTQSIVDYETVNTEEEISFQGVVQPLTTEALQLKPLETRSWEWLMIHTRTSAEIFTNDLIRYDGKEYKVMFEKNYSLNGYYEYHLVKDYE
jgi:hypothetical protein